MDSGHEFSIGGVAKVEWRSPVDGEVIPHILVRPSVLPVCPGLDICSSKLPCLNSFGTEDVSVDLFECVPFEVGPLRIEGVCHAAMIEARNGFLNWRVGVASSWSSVVAPIRLIGAVTAVGLVRPLSKWDCLDSAPSRGREGYVVAPKSGERVGAAVGGQVEPSPRPWSGQRPPGDVGGRGIDMFVLDVDVVGGEGVKHILHVLCESSLAVPCVPGAGGVYGVVSGVRRRSIAPWVCCLGSPYVPLRGAWVLNLGYWGATLVELPGATSVKLPGIVWGRELLLTRVVLVGGGIPNHDRSPVKGTGGGRCANGCQVRANCWSSSLEVGDDIVGWKWGGCPVGSRDPSSLKESQSLQVSADLLCVYEREDEDGGECRGNSNGYA